METIMESFSPSLGLFAIIFAAVWLFNSINVLREYERGVIFRLGRLLPEAKGPGLIFVGWPIDKIVKVPLANGDTGCASSGHHHERQCFCEGQRGGLLSCDERHQGHRGC